MPKIKETAEKDRQVPIVTGLRHLWFGDRNLGVAAQTKHHTEYSAKSVARINHQTYPGMAWQIKQSTTNISKEPRMSVFFIGALIHDDKGRAEEPNDVVGGAEQGMEGRQEESVLGDHVIVGLHLVGDTGHGQVRRLVAEDHEEGGEAGEQEQQADQLTGFEDVSF